MIIIDPASPENNVASRITQAEKENIAAAEISLDTATYALGRERHRNLAEIFDRATPGTNNEHLFEHDYLYRCRR